MELGHGFGLKSLTELRSKSTPTRIALLSKS